MSIGRKLSVGFGLVLLLMFISSVVTLYSFYLINQQVSRLITVEQPLAEAVLEIEINVGETVQAILNYVRIGEATSLSLMQDSIADFNRFVAQAAQLAETEEERQLLTRVEQIFGELTQLGDEAIVLKDEKDEALQSLRLTLLNIDSLIDEQLQPAINVTDPDRVDKLEAVLDMEINVNEAYSVVEAYLVQQNPTLRTRLADSEQDFLYFENLYREKELSPKEAALLDELNAEFNLFREQAGWLLDAADEEVLLLVQVEENLVAIDAVLDDELQPLIAAEVNEIGSDVLQRERLAGLAIIITALFGLVLGSGAALLIGRGITGSLQKLVESANRMGQGQLHYPIDVTARDETGVLAKAFQGMAGQLKELIDTLEEQVAARTRRLEIVVQVSERLMAILEVEPLLAEVIHQIKQNFDYYYAHIYLLDEDRENLVVAEGMGAAGAEMKARRHSIPLQAQTSLVARAARSGAVVSVDNVREASDWLPNPLLPDTYSEMAVPISLKGQVVGVLDVQQNEIAGLDESDAGILRLLANHVGVALRNARQFAEVESALTLARVSQERYLNQSWSRKNSALKNRSQFSQQDFFVDEQRIEQARERTSAKDKLSLVSLDQEHMLEGVDSSQQVLVAPIVLQDVIIGDLQIHGLEPDREWTENELAIMNAVIDQVAQSAESLRLFEETRQRASRERLIGQVSDRLRRAPDMETLMKIGVEEIAKVLHPARTFVKFGSKEELGGVLQPESVEIHSQETETVDNAKLLPAVAANGTPNSPLPHSGRNGQGDNKHE